VLVVVLLFIEERTPKVEEPEPEPFDAFAGGYPVPPMPGVATGATTVERGER
jgi:NADH-quinone oxidoreductase subunit H